MKQYGKTLPKDVEGLIELARQQDWSVSRTTAGHWRLINKRGRMVIHSGTPSDTNALWNFRAELKHHGLKPGKVRTIKAAPPAPKLVIDKSVKETIVEEKVNVPQLPGEAATVAKAKKTRKITPGLRGGKLRDALIEVLRKNDTESGVSLDVMQSQVQAILKIEKPIKVSPTLTWYKDKFTRVSTGRYRLTELMGATSPPKAEAVPTEDDDEKVLIEFLVALDKVGNIVKRHIELQKVLKQLQKLGTTK